MEIMSEAILHIWILPHQVQIVNLNMKMQFAPSKVYVFISCQKKSPHSFPTPQGKGDSIYHECGDCLKDLEAIFS